MLLTLRKQMSEVFYAKKLFLQIWQYSQENASAEVSF